MNRARVLTLDDRAALRTRFAILAALQLTIENSLAAMDARAEDGFRIGAAWRQLSSEVASPEIDEDAVDVLRVTVQEALSRVGLDAVAQALEGEFWLRQRH